jgi:hypothetical protein
MTTKQHPVLGNRFLRSKYTQPLLSNAFANKQFPWKRLEYKNKRRFIRGPCIDVTSRTTGARDRVPYVYDYITKLYRRQAEVVQNHQNIHFRCNGQGEARKYKRLKLGGGQAYDRSSGSAAVVA